MRIPQSLTSLGEAIFGSKFSSAFAADALDAANLGRAAVRRSHADAAKSIIDKAIKADAFTEFTINNERISGEAAKGIAQTIQTAYNKGNLGDIDIGSQSMDINKAMQTLIDDSITPSSAATKPAMQAAIKKFTSTEAGKLGTGTLYKGFDEGIISAPEFFGKGAEDGLGMKALSGFFQDPEFGSVRTKTVLGGGMAGAVGIRYLSGGDISHNARGEKDIAGIPFI